MTWTDYSAHHSTVSKATDLLLVVLHLQVVALVVQLDLAGLPHLDFLLQGALDGLGFD